MNSEVAALEKMIEDNQRQINILQKKAKKDKWFFMVFIILFVLSFLLLSFFFATGASRSLFWCFSFVCLFVEPAVFIVFFVFVLVNQEKLDCHNARAIDLNRTLEIEQAAESQQA